jgi:hypothetical protein
MSASKSLTSFVRRTSWLNIETRARAIGFLLILAIVIILTLRVELGQTWNLFASGMQNLKATDDYQLFLWTIGTELRPSDGELVLIVGGSTDRELTADDAFLSKILTKSCKKEVHVVNLGSSSQTFSETWDVIALAPEDQKRLVLVGINPYRLSFNDDDVVAEATHIATGIPNSFSLLWNIWLHTGSFVSPERYISSIERQRSLGAKWTIRDLFTSRQPVPMGLPEDPLQPHRSAYHEPVWTRAQKLRQANEYIANRVINFEDDYPAAVKWYKRLFDHFKTPTSDVKYLVLPTDETFDRADKLMSNDFRDALAQLGGHHTVIDLSDQNKNLVSSDFFDVQHLVASGRAKLQPALVDKISRALGCASEPSN